MATLVFGPFELDPQALELRRDGGRISIRPQPCRVLAVLASRPGELVTREELRATLWPDVFVRFDLGLNSCVKQIRAALGESADAPHYVETLSRRGYRLNAEVTPGKPACGNARDHPHFTKGRRERAHAKRATTVANVSFRNL